MCCSHHHPVPCVFITPHSGSYQVHEVSNYFSCTMLKSVRTLFSRLTSKWLASVTTFELNVIRLWKEYFSECVIFREWQFVLRGDLLDTAVYHKADVSVTWCEMVCKGNYKINWIINQIILLRHENNCFRRVMCSWHPFWTNIKMSCLLILCCFICPW